MANQSKTKNKIALVKLGIGMVAGIVAYVIIKLIIHLYN